MEFLQSWGWPQWVIVVLWASFLLMTAAMHDKPRGGNHNILVGMVSVGISAFILNSGGFFS